MTLYMASLFLTQFLNPDSAFWARGKSWVFTSRFKGKSWVFCTSRSKGKILGIHL